MKKKHRIILMGLILLIMIPYIWYIRQPMSKKDVLKRVSHEKGATYKAKEIKVHDLQEKMGVQLFQIEREDEIGSGISYFLADRLYSIGLLSFIEDQFGDFVCTDYDGDRKYEFMYVGSYPFTSGLVLPTLYVYEVKGMKIRMESAYIVGDESGYALKGGEDNKLYIYDVRDAKSDTEIKYSGGKWSYSGKLSQMLEFEDITDEIKENATGYVPKNLREF